MLAAGAICAAAVVACHVPALATEVAPVVDRPSPAKAASASGLAMYGEPVLPPSFDHLPYANPDAPKGGRLVVGIEGTFDSLNPYNLNAGSAAQGLVGTVYQPLMTRSRDEPFTLYGLVAKTVDTDADRRFVTFHLDPAARFSDGAAITADDVVFTFDLLKAHGRPQQRLAFSAVGAIATPDAGTVRFDLAGSDNRELPLIIALMPVLPRHATDTASFEGSSLAAPVGSGPYRVGRVEQGTRLVLVRDKTYWGRDLPTQRGLYNFDEIDLEYYRDGNAMFQAFETGFLDARIETNPQRWTSAYAFPAARRGEIVRETIPIGGPKGMDGFAFNLRRPMFHDVAVRRALASVFDFEWINAKIFDGAYKRTRSFFDDSVLSSVGRPASAAERLLLAHWPGAVDQGILAGEAGIPVTDGSGTDRAEARAALELLRTRGYRLADGRLQRDGRPFGFEIMVRDEAEQRLALTYANALARIGVAARVRRVDETQYERRRQTFDYDMIIGHWLTSASPGNEQRSRWGSDSADREATFNFAGVRNAAVDGLIETMLGSKTHDDFVTAVRAYDRVLRSGAYAVPLYHAGEEWVAHKRGLAHPREMPHYDQPVGALLETWWWNG